MQRRTWSSPYRHDGAGAPSLFQCDHGVVDGGRGGRCGGGGGRGPSLSYGVARRGWAALLGGGGGGGGSPSGLVGARGGCRDGVPPHRSGRWGAVQRSLAGALDAIAARLRRYLGDSDATRALTPSTSSYRGRRASARAGRPRRRRLGGSRSRSATRWSRRSWRSSRRGSGRDCVAGTLGAVLFAVSHSQGGRIG